MESQCLLICIFRHRGKQTFVYTDMLGGKTQAGCPGRDFWLIYLRVWRRSLQTMGSYFYSGFCQLLVSSLLEYLDHSRIVRGVGTIRGDDGSCSVSMQSLAAGGSLCRLWVLLSFSFFGLDVISVCRKRWNTWY